MDTLSLDLETFSSVDLTSAGVHKYAESPDFEILLFGFSVNYGPVTSIEVADGEKIPKEILDMLVDPSIIKTAYNAAFERTCLARYLGKPMPPEEWRCTMHLAAQAGLPLGLEAVGVAMGLPPDLAKKDGRALIAYFSKPCKPTLANRGRTRNMPWDDYDKWARYKSYNQRDVETENTIRKRLLRYAPDETEQRFWNLDQKINDKGVRLDLTLAENAIAFNDRYSDSLRKKAERISNLSNVTSTSQIKDWLSEVEGVQVESLNKKAMPELLAALKTDKAKEFLELRKELSKTSTAKFEKMITCACRDEHARGLFQFYGASRTGRFAGRLLQLQNLPQNHLEDIEETRALVRAGSYDELRKKHKDVSSTLSELIRTAIIPEPGCQFLVADFSAIEARVIAFLAGEEWRLDVFRSGGDIYCASASQIFGVPVVKNGINGHLRQRGKVAELALGYGGGVAAMRQMDTARALINESDEDIKKIVSGWRASSPRITALWYALENAAKKSIRTKGTAVSEVGNIRFDFEAGNLFMYLPSGRPIVYANAEIGMNRFGNSSILYAGTNQKTHKWEMLETYGGKLSENLTQATARDCLRECMMRLDAEGYDIRMHVHDEVIINEPKGGRTVEDVINIMRIPPEWAKTLPLNAAGFSADFYMKD